MGVLLKAVKWNEWGEEAFKRARKEDKPILLAISAAWCHWCHVMDKTSYSDSEVIRIINRRFIPIRVDTDKRPDINERYNMGGWPTTAFLTPEGELLTGGTYIPPSLFKKELVRVSRAYKENKKELYLEISRRKKAEDSISVIQGMPTISSKLDRSIIDEGTRIIRDVYDSEYGGFGNEPKFPHIEALEFVLHHFYLNREESFKDIAIKTLDYMGWGGMYDAEEGGFFRYSTTRDWSVPHYEKMLEDNAGFIRLYLEAFQVLGEDRYKEKALEVLKYVSSTLMNRESEGFYGSQDADGEYYKLKLEQRKEVEPPEVDRTIYSNWNGVMVSAYLQAFNLFGNPEWLEFSLKTLDFLKNCYEEGNGMFHYYDGKPNLPGLLVDQVYVSKALFDAYQTTMDRRYLRWGEKLVQFVIENHFDEKNGGFFDSLKAPNSIGYLKKRQKQLTVNADLATTLLDLYHLTLNNLYKEYAIRTLKSFQTSYQDYGIMASSYFSAMTKVFEPRVHAIIVGHKMEEMTKSLLKEALRAYHPLKVVQVLDPDDDNKTIVVRKLPLEKESVLYLCVGDKCLAPIKNPSKVKDVFSSTLKQGQ